MALELNGDHATNPPTVIANKFSELYKISPENLACSYNQLTYSFYGRWEVDSILLYLTKQNNILKTERNLQM